MLLNIHFTKALVLVSILGLVGIFTFNRIIQQNRLDIYRKYSHIVLPPTYEIKQNTSGTSPYKTDVLLVFAFDAENYESLIRLNKINSTAANRYEPNVWVKQGSRLTRKRIIDSLTTIIEFIHPQEKTLEFRFQQE